MSDSAMLYLQIALIIYQIRLLVFQTTDEASGAHVYKHLADILSWNVNVKLIAVGRAETGMTECWNTGIWKPEY